MVQISRAVRRAAVFATAASLVTLTACSSDSGSDSTSENLDGRGPITYVEGKDTTETGVVRHRRPACRGVGIAGDGGPAPR